MRFFLHRPVFARSHYPSDSEEGRKMLKTKLFWFSIGFASASAGVSLLVAKRLWASRETHSAELANKFGALEARVQSLEKDSLAKSSERPPVGSN